MILDENWYIILLAQPRKSRIFCHKIFNEKATQPTGAVVKKAANVWFLHKEISIPVSASVKSDGRSRKQQTSVI